MPRDVRAGAKAATANSKVYTLVHTCVQVVMRCAEHYMYDQLADETLRALTSWRPRSAWSCSAMLGTPLLCVVVLLLSLLLLSGDSRLMFLCSARGADGWLVVVVRSCGGVECGDVFFLCDVIMKSPTAFFEG